MTVILSKQALREQALQRRMQRAQNMQGAQRDVFLSELSNGQIPVARFAEGFEMNKFVRRSNQQGVVAEFIGTGNFSSEFTTRRRYEVDAGRDEEPLLYQPIYNTVVDSTLPRSVPVQVLGPAGVVFEEVNEGGEVKFATVGEYTKSITMAHYATGIQYSEDLFMYNELWRLPNLERQFGTAYNALLNHIHMNPIISHSYGAANQTDGTALTSFKATADLAEKYMRTIEAAIASASTDSSNPRRGPYAILCSTADLFTIERALGRVPQEGFDAQSSARGRVRSVVAYDGWTGTRGKKSVSYAGVSAGTAYLIDLSNRNMDFQSFMKHDLRETMGNGEPTRFIMEEVIYDVRLGTYASPVRAVEEITLPVAASGAS